MTAAKRKLIEVALPLETINRESAREKSLRHGHPSTLHLWWARRPLAACRAVLFAQLVDDPSSDPVRFPTEADQARERQRLFDLIERLVVWENSNDESLMKQASDEIRRSSGGRLPAILDPFAGGGSIPLEAQRLGLEAHASDLNPVAVLLNKALVEVPPRFSGRPPVYPGSATERTTWPRATGLAEDVRRYAQWMRDEAELRIGHMYPKVALPDSSSEANVLAWIWTRTVKCSNPACGLAMPLVKSWWLGKKKGKESYVVPHVARTASGAPTVTYSIAHELAGAPVKESDGTVSRNGAVCIACGTGMPLASVRSEGRAGRIGAQLMAVVAEAPRGRLYLAPTEIQAQAAQVPRPTDIPEAELADNVWDIKVKNYGLLRPADLFTDRQLTAMTTFSDLVSEARSKAQADAIATGLGVKEGSSYADGVALYLGLTASRMADRHSSLCAWMPDPKNENARNVFARQAISMVWDFAEVNPFGLQSGNFQMIAKMVAEVLEGLPASGAATVLMEPAQSANSAGMIVSTDPPYYDNVGYANLSDFFYVWLRRSLIDTYPDVLATLLTPKSDELVADPYRHGGRDAAGAFFEEGFTDVFARMRESASAEYPITVFYAFKQSESDDAGLASTGWQTLLEGMLRSGWEVTATWPIRTEMGNRIKAQDTNSLASSIVLALRPRPESAGTVSRRSFLAALKAELPRALRDLQQGFIAPVDLAQAAIGPGMAVFSRYARVSEADGTDMTVRTSLALINQVLDEVLSEQEGDFDPETRFCVKWFALYGWNDGPFGDAESLGKAVNTTVSSVERGGVFKAVAGKARLLHPSEMSDSWIPEEDKDISVWEVATRLAHALQEHGIGKATEWMESAKTRVDVGAVKELSYLLYSICERKGWTESAVLFNGLGTSWVDLASSVQSPRSATAAQGELDLDGDE